MSEFIDDLLQMNQSQDRTNLTAAVLDLGTNFEFVKLEIVSMLDAAVLHTKTMYYLSLQAVFVAIFLTNLPMVWGHKDPNRIKDHWAKKMFM
jgi:hypothetical protein